MQAGALVDEKALDDAAAFKDTSPVRIKKKPRFRKFPAKVRDLIAVLSA